MDLSAVFWAFFFSPLASSSGSVSKPAHCAIPIFYGMCGAEWRNEQSITIIKQQNKIKGTRCSLKRWISMGTGIFLFPSTAA